MDEHKQDNYFILHSLYLILSNISLGLSGVLFWYVAARLYSVENIGLGSGLISLSSLLMFISSLGITSIFVRFLPEDEDKAKLLSTFLGPSLILLVLICLISLVGLNFFLPRMAILRVSFYPFLFSGFVISMYLFHILDGIYISFKKTRLLLFKNIIQHFLRIGFLFLFTLLGGFGIFSSNCLSAIIAVVFSVIFFIGAYPELKLRFKIDFSLLKKLLPFSLVNFLNALSLTLPGMIFPLMAISSFSERDTGFFYIPWMMFLVYCSFITSINSVFLMKASYGEDVKGAFKKTLFFSFLLGVIGFVTFFFWGDKILLIFKKDFLRNSFITLRILFCSIFFFIINQVYITILNIHKKILKIGIISGLIIFNITIFTILFLPKMGGEGLALAWLVSNFLGSFYIIFDFLLRKSNKISLAIFNIS